MTDAPEQPTNVVQMPSRFRVHWPESDRVVSLPEVGDLDISQEPGGWRVSHFDYDGDHGAIIRDELPSRLEALRSAFSYALGCVDREARSKPGGTA